ncbi:hypothetical protein [Phaeovulum sp.]|uniref:hypothetical protein n=1 Tax=Phaeovulum sp. TaxID=2934796 RepID=UPI0039E5F8EC
MIDHNMKDFEQRLSRIDKIHQAGGAFEAAGTLGRAYYESIRPKARRSVWLGPLALFLVGALLFKSGLYAQLGPDAYVERVVALSNGTIADQIGAWILTADPLTVHLANFIKPLIG